MTTSVAQPVKKEEVVLVQLTPPFVDSYTPPELAFGPYKTVT